MDKEEYNLQSNRVSRYEALVKRLSELNDLLDKLEEGRSLKLVAHNPISSPVEIIVYEDKYKDIIITQLEVLRADLVKEILDV